MYIHISISVLIYKHFLDWQLSQPFHALDLFSPSNPWSPILFLDSSLLLAADNTGVLLVCILVKVPNWLMQWTARASKSSMFHATVIQIPTDISARQQWGAVLASLAKKAQWGFNLKRLTSEIQFLAALYNWLCQWHHVGSVCHLPTLLQMSPPKAFIPIHGLPITSVHYPSPSKSPVNSSSACSVTISEVLQHSHAKDIKPVNL